MPAPDSVEEFRRLVGEDPAFQRRVWTAQRLGWIGMGALVLFAALGGLGDGWLARREVASADGTLRLRHDAVIRQDTVARWEVRLPAGARSLTIGAGSVDRFDILGIHPRPARELRDAAGLTLEFDPPAEAVALRVEPRAPGMPQVAMASGAAALTVRLLVLP